jgi:alkanesulfonate monooxygenase SsuD/methylene tetrahydromethanopterin reductase-like flavin-dependent oxidoreductase (luciferase family)
MEFGAAIFFTDYSMGPVELGHALEERGFESLWAPEHSHIPLSRRSPFPQGGDLPKKYYDVMDPFVTLSAAAGADLDAQGGDGDLPRRAARSDSHRQAGRHHRPDLERPFLFGIGAGWNAEEMADHGTDFASRFEVMRERVEAMKAIWTKSKPEYDGKFVKFPPMMTWPKPAQKPHPPVIVGGAFPYGARRAIAYGDGWLPHARRPAYGEVIALLPEFRKMVGEAGRDPASIPVTIFGVAEDGDLIRRYRDAGVARILFNLPAAKADEGAADTRSRRGPHTEVGVSVAPRPTQFGRIHAPDETWLAKRPPEPILEPDLPIIDTHHHLWERPDHRYLLHEFSTTCAAATTRGHRVHGMSLDVSRARSRRDAPGRARRNSWPGWRP